MRGKEFSAFVRDARRKRNIEQVGTVVSQMIRRFGGLEQFTAAWKSESDLQVMSQDSSRRALDSFRTIADRLQSGASPQCLGKRDTTEVCDLSSDSTNGSRPVPLCPRSASAPGAGRGDGERDSGQAMRTWKTRIRVGPKTGTRSM